jgi:AcrR family transcriptional regulator
MGLCVADKGYPATTIADVVRHARVSKRTFYEYYPDKEACFLESYAALSGELLDRVAQAGLACAPEVAIDAAVHAYFSGLDERRELVRAFLSEIHGAGPGAMALRREIHLKFAALLRTSIDRARSRGAKVASLTPEMSIALVGGVNELVLCAVERGQKSALGTLADTAIALIRAVVQVPKAANRL